MSIYGWKFSFMVMRKRSPKNVISERISDDIPPQMKILNMVIPILMHFCSFISSATFRMKPHVI